MGEVMEEYLNGIFDDIKNELEDDTDFNDFLNEIL